MAETDTTTAPDPQEQYIQQMLAQLQGQPRTAVSGARARTEDPTSVVGLLGNALGGGASGSVPMSADESEAGGRKALLNFGLNLLANSGYSTDRKTVGQLIGGGIGAAQQSLGQSEYLKAARGQAQQDYAAQQQELQIARIKEALPLLNLQDEIRRAALARKLLGSGPTAGNTNIAAAGTYEGAIGGFEGTGKNPNSTAFGTGQFLESTWKDFAAANPDLFKGMTPEQVLAARANPDLGNKAITWLAQQNAATLASNGVAPSGASLGIAHWVGAGPAAQIMKAADNAPVAPFLSPEAVKANPQLATMTAGQMRARYANVPAPGFVTAAKPQAQPAVAGAPPARQPIPATDASGGTTAEAAPAPGRAQFAGPGAPPDATAPPPSPGAAGNADAIAAGMIARGADPTTLAPTGRGVTADEVTAAAAGPAAPTGPIVPAPAGPTAAQAAAPEAQRDQPDIKLGNGGIIRHPGTPADFRARNYQPPPTTEDFNPNLTEAENAAFAAKRAIIDKDRQAVQAGAIPRNKVSETALAILKSEGELNAEYQTALQAKRLKADANVTAWNQKQDADLRPLYQDAVKAYDTAAQAQLAHAQELEKQAQQGDIQSRSSKETADLTSRGKVLDQLNKEAMDSRSAVSELDGLAALSNNVDKPSVFATLKIGDTTVLNRLAQAGIVNADQAGGTQLLQSGISNAVARLRSGMSMGALSDRDLGFIESMAPNMYENKQTRAAVISYLRRAQDQKNRYNLEVNKLVADGKPISEALQTASETIEQKYPIVPARSQELGDHWLDPDPFWKKKRQDWAAEHNIRPGTMFRRADGGLEVIYSPGMQPVRQAVDVGGPR